MDDIQFIENKGQWEDNIQFKAKLPAGNIYLEENEITYQFYSEADIERLHNMHHQPKQPRRPKDETLRLHAFKTKFLGASTNQLTPTNPTTDYVNYYLGNDPSKWAAEVKKYRVITYQHLYTNINLKFYHQEGYLKYDFVVAPGGNVNDIKVDYSGVDFIGLEKGTLKIKTSVNEIIEQKPYAYQIIKGKQKEVKCNYVLNGNTVSYEFPRDYDHTKELIIDPILVFASYSGSTMDNWGFTSTFDDAGNLYGGGITFGVGYPTTIGAYQTNFVGGDGNYLSGCDVSITKFSPNGVNLVYSTYLGGLGNESPHSLVVNNNNELVIMGTTASADFPVTNTAYDTSYGGGLTYTGTVPNYINGSDIFVAKLNPLGTALLGSTYMGGSGNDGLNMGSKLNYNYADEFRGEVVVDASNNIYVASSTQSVDFPTIAGALQGSLSGMQDGCVFKLNDNLTTLVWSSYLGGTSNDAAYSLQFSSLGEIIITGGTESADFPTTLGTVQPTYQNAEDGWVTKINSSATSILASTFLGTADYDQCYLVQLDSANNVYVVGQTEGTYPIAPATVYNNPNSGQFLHKLDPTLATTLFSTTFGTSSGEVDIALSAFLVNECNHILISGWGGNVNRTNGVTMSTTSGLPITPGALQPLTDGSDYYLMVLDEDADTLLYSTFFGGNSSADHVDGGTSRFDKRGIVYQAVCSSCGNSNSDFPTTTGAWSTTDLSRNCNLGVFKIDLAALIVDADLYAGPEYCFGDTVHFKNLSSGGVGYYWDFGDGHTALTFEPSHLYENPGTYNVSLVVLDAVTCLNQDTDYVQVIIKDPGVRVRPDTIVCLGDEIMLWSTGGINHYWNPALNIADPTKDTTTAIIMGPTNFHLDVTNDGCELELEFFVDTLALPTVNLGEDIMAPWGSVEGLHANSNGVSFLWAPATGLSCNTCPDPLVTADESVTYYIEVQGANGCFNYDTINIFYDGSLYVPNSFTPNGDGTNDIFYAYGKDIVEFELFIFDRWGEKIFYANDMEKGWDGKYKGVLAQTEAYVWKINFIDSFGETGELFGTVTLLR